MVDETEAGKGRATPSRKEALAARKKQMKTPLTRKEQVKRERAARESLRARQREALKTGDERYLPARERGPVRRFCRDYVDRRLNFGEFLLPILLVILIAVYVAPVLTSVLWAVLLVTFAVDETRLLRGLRKELKARFDAEDTRGAVSYTFFRSTQLRRFRLPKPQIKRGAPLAKRYQ